MQVLGACSAVGWPRGRGSPRATGPAHLAKLKAGPGWPDSVQGEQTSGCWLQDIRKRVAPTSPSVANHFLNSVDKNLAETDSCHGCAWC